MVDDSVDRRGFLRRTGMAVGAAAIVPVLDGCAPASRAAVAHGTAAVAHEAGADPDTLFRSGDFRGAERGYRARLRRDPGDAHAAARLGYIALLSNRFGVAERYLTQAVRLAPGDVFSLRQLADCFVRQDLLSRAVNPLRATGDARDAAMAALYVHVTGAPWQVRGAGGAKVPLLTLDPLPQTQVSINQAAPRAVVLDTGATSVDCSMELAREAGLQAVSTSTAVLGGREVTVYLGIADSVRVGDLEVRNVPVQWHDSPPLGDSQGVMGTTFFYHFRTTIDYANRQFLLRPKNTRALAAEGRNALPLWLANEHIPVTLGRLNDFGPRLVTLDTGGIGRGLDTTVEIAKRAGIAVDLSHPIAGPGPVGYPITPDRISLGDAVGRHVPGIARQNPPGDDLMFDTIGNFTDLFFRPFAVTFDFAAMKLHVG
jgi:hypothetical protein